MEYYDEELLKAKRDIERKMYVTLETGIYVDDNLITFTKRELFDSTICLYLPDQFISMPELVKNVKYPSKDAPMLIMTSLDSTINMGFNLLPKVIQDGDINGMSICFQDALKSVNPSINIKRQIITKTKCGNEMSWFEYKGYQLDGQSYNRICLVKMRKNVLHCIFNCQLKDQDSWKDIIEKCYMSIEEKL